MVQNYLPFKHSTISIILISDHIKSKIMNYWEEIKNDRYIAFYSENPEDLTKLARHSKLTIRELVASNPYTPTKVLDELSMDVDYHVRSTVAKNPNTSVETLVKLSETETRSIQVLFSLARNKNTPAPILEKIYIEFGFEMKYLLYLWLGRRDKI